MSTRLAMSSIAKVISETEKKNKSELDEDGNLLVDMIKTNKAFAYEKIRTIVKDEIDLQKSERN